jgi:hypothetical protein
MTKLPLLLSAAVFCQSSEKAIEPKHAANPVYKELITSGATLDGTSVRLATPLLRDGQPGDEQRGALRSMAGSDRALDDLLRDSVTAPQILKVRDEPSRDGTIVRGADLWFVVYADLTTIHPLESARQAEKEGATEAGNMRFETHLLSADDLKARSLSVSDGSDAREEWYAHMTGLLLDKIHVEATTQVCATRSAESVVVAARTARAFDSDEKFPNRWWPITRKDGRDEAGAAKPYAGGISYAKISQLDWKPGALLVEAHFAFAEPRVWFDGAPILRSKLALVAQDQIRRLRRELAKKRNSSAATTSK